MKSQKLSVLGFGLSLFLGILGNTAASNAATFSDLSSIDLTSPGDNLLTLDSTTGLKWLDVSETYDRTIADGEIPGFRLATFEEVTDLFSGFPRLEDLDDDGAQSELISLISIFGGVDGQENDYLGGLVKLDDGSEQATTFTCAEISQGISPACRDSIGIYELDESIPLTGVYMVQADSSENPAPVPEPSTVFGFIAVLATGIILKQNSLSKV